MRFLLLKLKRSALLSGLANSQLLSFEHATSLLGEFFDFAQKANYNGDINNT